MNLRNVLAVTVVLFLQSASASAQPVRVTTAFAVMYQPPHGKFLKSTGRLWYAGLPRNGGVYDYLPVAQARLVEIVVRYPHYRVWIVPTPKVR